MGAVSLKELLFATLLHFFYIENMYDVFSIIVAIYCFLYAASTDRHPIVYALLGYFFPVVGLIGVHLFHKGTRQWIMDKFSGKKPNSNKRRPYKTNVDITPKSKPVSDRKKRKLKNPYSGEIASTEEKNSTTVQTKKPKKKSGTIRIEEYKKPKPSKPPVFTFKELEKEKVKIPEEEIEVAPPEDIVPDVKLTDIPEVSFEKPNEPAEEEPKQEQPNAELPVEEDIEEVEAIEEFPVIPEETPQMFFPASTLLPSIVPFTEPEGSGIFQLKPKASLGCQLDLNSDKNLISGLNKIKFSRCCPNCSWVDNKSFTFIYSDHLRYKKDNYLCPSCLSWNLLEIQTYYEELTV